jgi:hypothetical protein
MSRDRQLSTEFPPAPLLPFGQFSTPFIETRRAELEAYFQAVAPKMIGYQPAEKFLGVGDKSIPFRVRPQELEFRLEPLLERLIVALALLSPPTNQRFTK